MKRKIAIIAAMDKEVSLLLHQMPGYREVTGDGFSYYEGNVDGHEVAVMKCGIGKVNAAVNTYRLIKAFKPELVVNSGVAGGMDPEAGIGAVVVSDGVIYHDVWCGPGTEWGVPDGFSGRMTPDADALEKIARVGKDMDDFHTGLIVSGDIFVSDPEVVAKIKTHFPEALGCDMESGAIAQVCGMEGVPFIVVRVLSDRPGSGDNISEYKDFWGKAPERTFEVIRRLIREI